MAPALTAVIGPSRILRLLRAGFGMALCAAALALVLHPAGYMAGPAVAGALLFAGLCVLHTAGRRPTLHRIDISGPGRMRLTVQQDVGLGAAGGMQVALLPGSTLWPRLMFLLLAGAGGTARPACRHVAVLPDSLAPEAFRALAVALGGSAAQASSGLAGTTTEHNMNLLQRANSNGRGPVQPTGRGP